MIGDRPDTDMLMAFNAGIDRCLALTGVVTSELSIGEWLLKDPNCGPTSYIQSFGIME